MCAILVTVRFKVDPRRVAEVDRTSPELEQRLVDAARQCGCVRHERWYSSDEVIDLDYWETEEQRETFLRMYRAQLIEWSEAVGALGWTSEVWVDDPGGP